MDGILYLLIFACLGLVAIWYVVNEARSARGGWGILAIRDSARAEEAGAEGPSRFRPSDRVAPDPAHAAAAFATGPGASETAARASRFREKAPRGFRDRDEARFRSRGPLPRFGDKPDRAG